MDRGLGRDAAGRCESIDAVAGELAGVRHHPGQERSPLWEIQTVGFRTLDGFFVITHDRGELVHFTVTSGASSAGSGVVGILTPVRAPRANSIAERVARAFRQQCLDYVIVISERQLHALLTELVRYYNRRAPSPQPRTAEPGAA